MTENFENFETLFNQKTKIEELIRFAHLFGSVTLDGRKYSKQDLEELLDHLLMRIAQEEANRPQPRRVEL